MPLPGLGIVPAAGSVYNELTAVTRRAFIPRLFVQMYFASPTFFHLMGNAVKSAGGLSQISIPIQGQSMGQGGFIGPGGGFNQPQQVAAIQTAQFNSVMWAYPVPLPFGEQFIQSSDAVINLLKARMNDVYASTIQNLAPLAFSSNPSNPLYPNGFNDAFDNGTNYPTYGGINRMAAGNQAWKGQYYSATGSVATTGFSRKLMSQYLIRITDAAGGEKPTFVVMNPADYSTLNDDFIGIENIYLNPGKEHGTDTGVRSAFPNVNVAGVPVYSDHFCPKGNAYAVNTNYTSMFIAEDAAFEFTGFHSLVPLGQIGQQGVVIFGYNIVTAKPSANAWITNIGGAAY